MRKLGVALAMLLASTAFAAADSVTITASDTLGNSVTLGPDSSGFFQPSSFSLPGGFNVVSVNAGFRGTPNGITAPGLLNTNTLDIDNQSTVLQTLTIDVKVTGNAPPSGLQAITSAFDSVGLTPGWTLHEATFVNGVLQRFADFTGTGGTGPLLSTANFGAGPTWTLDAVFTITNGTPGSMGPGILGDVNAGIKVESVPGPIVGAGLPGLLAAMGLGRWTWRRRRKTAAAA